MIDAKKAEWLSDPKMNQYLRPQTLALNPARIERKRIYDRILEKCTPDGV